MAFIHSHSIQCPYCGQPVEIVIDSSIADQNYVEDCQVCCRPILLKIRAGGQDDIRIVASQENE